MEMELEKDFNPFYDSAFMISLENDEAVGRRYLVELCYDELIRLRNEIDCIIGKSQPPRVAMAFGGYLKSDETLHIGRKEVQK